MQPQAYVVFEPLNHVMQVVQAAKRRGFHIISVRTFPLSTVAPYSNGCACIDHDVVVENWLDTGALMAVLDAACTGYDVVGTYAAAEFALSFEALFRQKHGLRGLAPAQLAFLLDKERVRTRLAEAGLTRLGTISQEQALAMTDWPAGATYFFKPVHGTGSTLVARCASLEQLRTGIANWREKPEVTFAALRGYIESNNRFFLEQAADGELMSVEGFMVDGEYRALGLSSRSVLERDETVEMGVLFPYRHPAAAAIIEKVRAIHHALGFNNGPTHAEIIYGVNGEIELVELNVRFAGADMLLTMEMALGIDVGAMIVATTLGEKTDLAFAADATGTAVLQILMPPPGLERFESIEFPAHPIAFSKLYIPLGTALQSTRYQSDQIAAFIVRADDAASALRAGAFVRSNTRVNGVALACNSNNVVVLR